MKSRKILIKALKDNKLSQRVSSNVNITPGRSFSNSNKENNLSLYTQPKASCSKIKNSLTINIRSKSNKSQNNCLSTPINKNQTNNKNYITFSTNKNVFALRRKGNTIQSKLATYSVYNNSFSTLSRNRIGNTHSNNYIVLSPQFYTTYSNIGTPKYINSSNNNSIANASSPIAFYSNVNSNSVAKRSKGKSVLKSTIKKKLYIKSFINKAENERNEISIKTSKEKFCICIDYDQYKDKIDAIKRIKLIKYFKEMRIFYLWKKYTTKRKRKLAIESIKNKIENIDINLIKKYNEISSFENKIIKSSKEGEIDNEISNENLNIVIEEIRGLINKSIKEIFEVKERENKSKSKNNNINSKSSNTSLSKSKILNQQKFSKKKILLKKSQLINIEISSNLNSQGQKNTKERIKTNKVILNSISLYIMKCLIHFIIDKISRFRYKLIYSYDKKAKRIISEPSNEEIKDKLNSLIEGFKKNSYIKIDISALSEYISCFIKDLVKNEKFICDNRQLFLSIYTNSNQTYINYSNLKSIVINKNIINDFSVLKRDKLNKEKEDIKELISNIERKIVINIKMNIQQIKYDIVKIQKRISEISKDDLKGENFIERIKRIEEQLEKQRNIIIRQNTSEVIENKINIITKTQNLTELISLIEIISIKYNILYEDFTNILSNLSLYFSSLGNNKLLQIPQLFNDLIALNGINSESIKCKLLYDEFIAIITNNTNLKGKKLYINLNKLLSLKQEITDIYNKFNNSNKEINSMYFNIEKYNDNINILILRFLCKCFNIPKIKRIDIKSVNDIITFLHFNKNKIELPSIDLNDKDIYVNFVLQLLNNNYLWNTNTTQNDKKNNNIEAALFKFISNKDKFTLKDKNNLSILFNQYYFSTSNNGQEFFNQIIEQINHHDINSEMDIKCKDNLQLNYPKLYLLNANEFTQINNEPLSINSISSLYSKINPKHSLIISKNNNTIIGVKIYHSMTQWESLSFKNQIQILLHNEKEQNILYLSNIYIHIEEEIAFSLREQTFNQLSQFNSITFIQWLNSSLSQVSLCSICLIFTNQISQLLSSQSTHYSYKKQQKNPLKKEFEFIISKYTKWIKECNIYNVSFQSNIILTLINHINIIETLISKNIQNVDSFEWMKYIRHLWDQSKKEVVIECGGWTNYQMKRLITTSRILLTPDTDKIFLFTSSCFREKSASIIKVGNNRNNNIQSYREIFEEFCSIFWTEMIEINITFPISKVKEIFDIATKGKLFIYMEHIDIFDYDSDKGVNYLVYLSKFMQIIQQEVILNDIKSDDNEMMFCLMGCVLIDNNIKNKENALKSSSRVLNFVKPDMKYYFSIIKKFFAKGNAIDNVNKAIDEVNRFEKEIRNRFGSFYYDFDFYNAIMRFFILNKYATNEEFGKFIEKYNIRFDKVADNEKEGDLKKKIEKFLNERKVIYSDVHIELFEYLSIYYYKERDSFAAIKPIICGFGSLFIAKEFIKFIKDSIERNGSININISQVYDERELRFKMNLEEKEIIIFKGSIVEETNEKFKVFNLPQLKSKKLLKCFFDKIIQRLAKMEISISDEFHLSMVDFAYRLIKSHQPQNSTYIYTSSSDEYSLYKWILFFLNKIPKQSIKLHTIIDIIIQSFIFIFGFTIELNEIIYTNLISIFRKELSFDYLNCRKGKYILFNIRDLKFKTLEKYDEFLKEVLREVIEVVPSNEKIALIITESEINSNIGVIGDIIENFSNKREIDKYIIKKIERDVVIPFKYEKHIKVFIGRNYDNIENDITIVKKDEKVKKLYKIIYENGWIKNDSIAKFEYILSSFDIYSLNEDDIKFIYSIVHLSFYISMEWNKFDINFSGVSDYIKIIKNIIKIMRNCDVYLTLSNTIIDSLFKKIFPKAKFTKDPSPTTLNRIVIDTSNYSLLNSLINQYLQTIYIKNTSIKQISLLLNIKEDNNNVLFYRDKNTITPLQNDDILSIVTMLLNLSLPEQNFNTKFQKSNYIKALSSFLIQILFTYNDFSLYNSINFNNISIFSHTQLLFYYIINSSLNGYLTSFLIKSSFLPIPHQKELSMLIIDTISNYKFLISNKKEFINTNLFYFNSLTNIISTQTSNFSKFILEKLYVGVSNHFLLSLVLTLELMLNNFVISQREIDYIIQYLNLNFIFPNDNSIKFINSPSRESERENGEASKCIINSGKALIDFYQKNTNVSLSHLSLLQKSSSPSATKYFYTNSVSKIERDVDKLLYYMTFIPEQSPSIFKYLINKYLLPIYSLNNFTVNGFLKNRYNIPITIKADNSINITNFLCSLAAFYEIDFFVVRNIRFEKVNLRCNEYKYIIDDDLRKVIKDGKKEGDWIFISDKMKREVLLKIIFEVAEDDEKKINKKFKIFLDQRLMDEDCREIAENFTMMLNIENANVDDLEAAHDVWVNVLEEKILTESIMDETQKDFYDVNSNEGKNNVSEIKEGNDFNRSNLHYNVISNFGVNDNSSYSELSLLGNIK